MSGIATVGSICTGHDGFPSRQAITGSSTVFINGLSVHCVGDLWETHCDSFSCHDGTLVTGSPTIFVSGLPVGLVGDLISCGSTIATGSDTVGS